MCEEQKRPLFSFGKSQQKGDCGCQKRVWEEQLALNEHVLEQNRKVVEAINDVYGKMVLISILLLLLAAGTYVAIRQLQKANLTA